MNCINILLDEMKRDPELEKIVTALVQRDERIWPVFAAVGAFIASETGAAVVGGVVGAVAGWLSTD